MTERPLDIWPHPGCRTCHYHRLFLPLFPGPVEVWSLLTCSPTSYRYSWHCEACRWSGLKSRDSQVVVDAAERHRCGFPDVPAVDGALW